MVGPVFVLDVLLLVLVLSAPAAPVVAAPAAAAARARVLPVSAHFGAARVHEPPNQRAEARADAGP